jgi:acetolactate synthase regulatory subunit
MRKIQRLTIRSWMRGGVSSNKAVKSLIVLQLIRESKGWMMREGLGRMRLLLRLFVSNVEKKVTRVMLVVRMRWSGVSVVALRGTQFQNASMTTLFISIAVERDILLLSVPNQRRPRLGVKCLL